MIRTARSVFLGLVLCSGPVSAEPPRGTILPEVPELDAVIDSLAALSGVRREQLRVDAATLELEGALEGEMRLHRYLMREPLRTPSTVESVCRRLAGVEGRAVSLLVNQLSVLAWPEREFPDPFSYFQNEDANSVSEALGSDRPVVGAMQMAFAGTGKRFQGKDRESVEREAERLPPLVSTTLAVLIVRARQAAAIRNRLIEESSLRQGGPFAGRSKKTAEQLRRMWSRWPGEKDMVPRVVREDELPARDLLEAARTIDRFEACVAGAALAMYMEDAGILLQTALPFEPSLFHYEWSTPWGRIGVGGTGPNRFRGHYLLILDLGGNDEYEGAGSVSGLEPVAVVLDLGGDDRYAAADSGLAGPGGALLGYAGIVDLGGGRDRYTCATWGCGSGILGVGWIHDDGGDDVYRMQWLSGGAGVLGMGILVDRSGSDRYEVVGEDAGSGRGLSLGFGGPEGIGLLIDQGGDDEYLCPAQGAIVSNVLGAAGGVLPIYAGGLGILVEVGGDDTYRGSGTGKGLGYAELSGLGWMVDWAGGDTLEFGGESFGTGTRAGVGVFLGGSGDDLYRGGGFGSGADLGMGFFVETAGNDVYTAATGSHSSFGSARDQGAGWFFEVEGKDIYGGLRIAPATVAPSEDAEIGWGAERVWRTGVPAVAVFADLDRRRGDLGRNAPAWWTVGFTPAKPRGLGGLYIGRYGREETSLLEAPR